MSDPVKRERELRVRGGVLLTLLANGRGWPRELQQDVLKSVIRILRGENIDLDYTRVVLNELAARPTEPAEDGSVGEPTAEELATMRRLAIGEWEQEGSGFRRMTEQEIGEALWLGSPPEALEELCTVLHMGVDLGLLRQDRDGLWAVSLRETGTGAGSGDTSDSLGAALDEVVTLNQVAPLTGKSKRTLERYLKNGTLPAPDIPGGEGKAHKWYWRNLRPALSKFASKQLPERFPGSRII